jgi:endonuclease/exonuclease/phosphatase family metal-dependent hydrolase
MRLRTIVAKGILALSICSVFSIQPSFAKTNVTLMTYNTENLFDAVHDPGTNDWQYLPVSEKKPGSEAYNYCQKQGNFKWGCLKLDWTEEAYKAKLFNIAAVIRAFQGKGPDVVVLEEVESIRVLWTMVQEHLWDLGYINVQLIEGFDQRGIDIGLISKYSLAGNPVLHPVGRINEDSGDVTIKRQGRGIFEVPLWIDGKVLTVLGNHWPSQMNKVDGRILAAQSLKAVLNGLPKGTLAVALGDFNTKEEEDTVVFKDNLLQNDGREYFMDAYSECQKQMGQYCTLFPGSYYYNEEKRWDRFDRIFFSSSFKDNKEVSVDFRDFTIFTPMSLIMPDGTFESVVTSSGVPFKFSTSNKKGFSDHFPVAIQFELN